MVWINRLLLVLLVVFAVAYLPQRLATGASADDLTRVEGEHAALQQRNERLRGEIAALKAEVAALKRDPAEVARIAREDLNLVRPGELVFEVRRAPPKAP